MKNPNHSSDDENRLNENKLNANKPSDSKNESHQKEKSLEETIPNANIPKEKTRREPPKRENRQRGNRPLNHNETSIQQDNPQLQQEASSSPQTRRPRRNTSSQKTDNASNSPLSSPQSLTLTNKQGVTKITRHQNVRKTKTIIGEFTVQPQRQPSKGAGTRPSMAKMIEAARNAEARRRAENESIQGKLAQEVVMTRPTDSHLDISGKPDILGGSDTSGGTDISGGPDVSGCPEISGKAYSFQEKDKNAKKTAPSGDDVKTAQVLKRAAEIARAKKDPITKPSTYHKDTSASNDGAKIESDQNILETEKPSNRSRKWGSLTKGSNKRSNPVEQYSQQNNQLNNQPNNQQNNLDDTQQNDQQNGLGNTQQLNNPINTQQDTQHNNHLSTRQSRAQRVAEAMRHLKESSQPENIQPKRSQAQKRLEETLEKMNLNNPATPLLLVALTHPSYTFENPNMNKENNQRLEFLGDAVLDFIVGEYLYLEFPDKSEGELTKIRAAVVNEGTLAQAARNIQLGDSLFLGRGEQVSGGRERPSILADALEAIIGAFYLQEGFDAARQFVLDMLVPIIDEVNQDHYGDFKTLLQEVAQHDERAVNYRILDELGPDHNKSFTAGVFIQGVLKGKGTGRTKKEAEQLAARLALENWEAHE